LKNVEINQIKFILILAFAITAISYFIYQLNREDQQDRQHISTIRNDLTHTRTETYYSSYASTEVESFPVQTIKQNLVLVISVAQQELAESLRKKRIIADGDCEKLYKATQYLCLVAENNLNYHIMNEFLPKPEDDPEDELQCQGYDVYLLLIQLNKVKNGFKRNVT